MRIRYKIWDKHKKCWVRGLVCSNGFTIVSQRGEGPEINNERYAACIYTGLIDNSGERIYSGDILAYPNGCWETGDTSHDDRMEVYYDNTLARFGLKFFSMHGGEGFTGRNEHISDYVQGGALVIGNINSNPDLI